MLARKKQAAATACSICVLLLTGKWFQLIVRPTNSPQQGLQRLQSPGGRKQAKEGKKWCQQRSGGKFKLPGRLSVNTDRSRAIITLRARVILLKWPFNDYCMPGLLLVVATGRKAIGRRTENAVYGRLLSVRATKLAASGATVARPPVSSLFIIVSYGARAPAV